MKRTQRILSLLLALVLLCGLLPWELIPRAAAAEPAAETSRPPRRPRVPRRPATPCRPRSPKNRKRKTSQT